MRQIREGQVRPILKTVTVVDLANVDSDRREHQPQSALAGVWLQLLNRTLANVYLLCVIIPIFSHWVGLHRAWRMEMVSYWDPDTS
jgi:hypothetical protein